MTVKELIKQLEQLPKNLPVIAYNHDEEVDGEVFKISIEEQNKPIKYWSTKENKFVVIHN